MSLTLCVFVEQVPSADAARPDGMVCVQVFAPLAQKRIFDRAGRGDLALTAREVERLLALYGRSL